MKNKGNASRGTAGWGIILLLVSCMAFPLPLAAGETQLDLNGFRLWQCREAAAGSLGQPFKTMPTGYSRAEVFRIDEKAYMVFECLNEMPENIYAIQLTGATAKAAPFKGLVLGDDVKKVKAVLGEPTHIEKIEDPKVSRFDFEGTNYNVEIDDKGKLCSIRICADDELVSKGGDIAKDWAEFKASVLSKDIKRIAAVLRPDVEVYKGGRVLAIKRSMGDFVQNPDKEMLDAFIGDKGSVSSELLATEPEMGMRVHEELGLAYVIKFGKGKILKEIVFLPYNGRFCAYEAAFR